ncbi:MAG: hypothetical protein K5695_14055 [Oscillospiraceae bacterium]|nr:hypothetical protein [Oscillospiraceae bacterium]
MSIQKYNCVTPENAVNPKYTPNPADRKIQVYYTDKNQVIIVGVADNNFIHWLSVTKMDDLATNRAIFTEITANEPKLYGHLYLAVEKTKYSYEKVEGMYSAELRQAEMIVPHYEETKKLCKMREMRGKYIEILRCYLDMLSVTTGDARADYDQYKVLIKLIKSENYLRLSDNDTVRKLYQQLEARCFRIYQDYMTEARGGA